MELSKNRPSNGSIKDTDSIPSPPITDIPKAPLSGMFSEMKAKVVGQKKVMPMEKRPAAKNTLKSSVFASICRPINANIEEVNNIPVVFNFAAIGPANARPMIIIPFIKANTNSAFTPVSLNKDSMR